MILSDSNRAYAVTFGSDKPGKAANLFRVPNRQTLQRIIQDITMGRQLFQTVPTSTPPLAALNTLTRPQLTEYVGRRSPGRRIFANDAKAGKDLLASGQVTISLTGERDHNTAMGAAGTTLGASLTVGTV